MRTSAHTSPPTATAESTSFLFLCWSNFSVSCASFLLSLLFLPLSLFLSVLPALSVPVVNYWTTPKYFTTMKYLCVYRWGGACCKGHSSCRGGSAHMYKHTHRQGHIIRQICCNISSSTLDGDIVSLYCAATVNAADLKSLINHIQS